MADIIQANYDQLADVAKRFGTQSETTAQTLQSITRVLDKLQGGDWIGRGSDAFFAEVENEVLPGIRRLIDALRQAGQVTNEISTLIQQADEEASAPFRNGNGSGITTGGGTSGNTNPAGTTTDRTPATSNTAGNSAIDRFAQMASAVYPAEQGSGSGSWQNGTFSGNRLGTNEFATLVNGRGFSAGGDLSNPYGPGFALSTDDGFGRGTSGFTSGGNDFGIPHDWLSGVTGDGSSSLNSYLNSGFNDHGIPRDWLSGVHDAMSNSERAGMSVPRDWLSGVMAGFNDDLNAASTAALGNSDGGGSSGGGSGSSDSGGSSGGGSGTGGGGSPTGESPAETSTTEAQTPMGGGGGGTGTPQSQLSDPYGRGGFGQGYSQTTVSAAEGEQPAPRLRYQPTSGGGGGIVQEDPPLARVNPTAGWPGGGGTVQIAAAPSDSGLRALSLGIAAVSPLLALAGKLVKDKLGDAR